MFFGTFSWSFVYISLPFHIQAMTTWDEAAALRWTGWIIGITPLLTVVTAPLWGRLGHYGNPKSLYVAVQVLQGLCFFGMAAARTLVELFISRLLLGVMGAASTFAFMHAGRVDDARQVRRQVAAVQSAMTVGQVIGPLAGAIAAARLGFRASFALGGLMLVACGWFVHQGMPSSTPAAPAGPLSPPARWRDVLAVSLVVLGGSTQVFFLASVLPQVLLALGVDASRTLEIGGMLIFTSGVAAALGSVAAPRLSELVPERRLLTALLIGSSTALVALALARSAWPYGIVRFVQVLCVAPVFPIIVARIAHSAGGGAIGVINAARIGAGFLGPVLATSLLAWTSPTALYVALAAIGVACVPVVASRAAEVVR